MAEVTIFNYKIQDECYKSGSHQDFFIQLMFLYSLLPLLHFDIETDNGMICDTEFMIKKEPKMSAQAAPEC